MTCVTSGGLLAADGLITHTQPPALHGPTVLVYVHKNIRSFSLLSFPRVQSQSGRLGSVFLQA